MNNIFMNPFTYLRKICCNVILISIPALLVLLPVSGLKAQNAIVGTGFSSGWGGGSCPTGNGNFTYLSAGAGTSYIYTGHATATGTQYWRFGVDWSGTTAQYTNTNGSNTAVSPNTQYSLTTTCTTSGALDYSVPSTSYNYIFKTLNAGTSPTGTWVFFEVQGTVQTVSSVTQVPASGSVYNSQSVVVTANLSGALSAGQAVYLRYTTNAYSTSTVVNMTGSGTAYTATIPAFASGTAVSYYVFTSGPTGGGLLANGTNADLFTINLNNNSGSNYSYTVASYCTPSSTSSTTYINKFSTTGGTANITNNNTGYTSGGYKNYAPAIFVTQTQGGTVNWSVTIAGGTAGIGIWVDWNQNGVFTDAGENVYNSNAYKASGTYTGSFTVPAGAVIGSTSMRVLTDYYASAPVPCTINASGPQGEAEDYEFNVTAPPAPTITSYTPAAFCSAGGQTVTITGTNFTAITSVKFNGTAATSYTVVSSTSITAVVPSGVTAGSITVTNSGGTATSSAYTVTAMPTITTNPSATSVNLYATGTGTGTFTAATSTGSPTYQWQYGTTSTGPWTNVATGTPSGVTYTGATSATLSAACTAITPAGSAYYYHCVITAGGCSSTTTSAQFTISNYCLNTSSSPTYYLSAVSTSGGITNINQTGLGVLTNGYTFYSSLSPTLSQVAGGTFTVTTSNSDGEGIGIWIDWNQNGVFTDAGEQMSVSGAYEYSGYTTGTLTVPSGTAAGTYRMRIVGDDANTSPSVCTGSTTTDCQDYNITVVAPAIPTITSFTPTALCSAGGQTVTITGTNFTGTTAVNFNGTAATSFTVVSATSITAVVPSGVTAGNITVTNAGGTATSPSAYTVTTTPAAGITGTTPACGSITLTATPASGVTYAWSGSGGSASTATYSASGTYSVTVTASGCTATASKAVVVNTAINITAQPSTANVSYCAGSTVTALTVTATGTSPTYQWYSNTSSSNSGGTLIGGATSASYTPSNAYTTGAATYYYCVVSGASPCTAVTSNVSGGITINQSPTITSSPSATSVNAFAAATTSFTVATSAGSPTYQWQYATTSGGTYANVVDGTPTGITYGGTGTAATLSIISASTATAGTGNYYRCVVTAAGCSTTSGNAQLTINNYCKPASTSSSYFINNFSTTGGLTNITNNGSGYSTGGYGNFTSQSVSQYANSAINFSITGDGGGTYTYGFAIWVDWNNNGTFETGEQMYVTSGYVTSTTGSFTVPSGTAAGSYRMRVFADYYNSAPNNPCAFSTTGPYGEAEDYTVTVVVAAVPTITSFTPAALCSAGGQTVTITGTNFSGVTAVNFNGTAAASYTVVSATSITATSPSGVTAGNITVTTGGGTATSPSAYTVTTTPTVPALTGGASTVCVGSTTAAFADATGGGVWSITAGTGTATVSAGAVTGTGAGTVTVVYTVTNSGCSASASSGVTVNAAPTAVTVTPATASVCNGTITTLTGSGGGGGTTTVMSQNFNAVITGNNGLPSGWSTTNNGGWGYDWTNTSYFASAFDDWNGGAGGGYGGTGNCVYFIAGDLNAGTTGSLTSPAMNLSTYAGATLTFYIYNSDATDVLKVYAKNGSGGTYAQVGVTYNTAYTSWTQITVNLNSYAGSGFTAVYLQFRGTCGNQSSNIAIDNVVVTGTTAPTFTWAPTTALYTDAAATTAYTGTALTTVYAKPTATQTYTATYTNGSGCTASNTATITVSQPSAAPTGISATNTTLCSGSGTGTTLTATGGTLGTGATYQWGTGAVVGTSPISGATSVTYSVTPTATTAYWVSITGAAPCGSPTGGATTTITVNTPSVAPSGISGTTSVCSGVGTTLTATGGTLGTGANYQWGTGSVIGTSPISGATSVTYSVTPASTTTYWVSVTGSGVCGSPGGGATTTVTVTPNQWTGAISADWTVGGNWCSGIAPLSTTDVTIPDASSVPHSPVIGLTTSTSAVCNNLTLASGASLTMSTSYTATLTLSAGASFTNNATTAAFSAGTGTVYFAGAGAISGTAATTFNNLTISTGTVTVNTVPTINGTFQINGGNLTQAPIYGPTSTLYYNTSYGRYVEWNATGVGTIGTTPGYPNNVTVGSGTLDVYNSASGVARALNGTLTVNSGATMNFNGMNAAFTAGASVYDAGTINMNTMSGAVSIGTSLTTAAGGAFNMNSMSAAVTVGSYVLNNGSLSLSSAGGGDIYVAGNWTRGASGTFTPSSRAVFLNGTGTQVVTVTGGGTETFNYLLVNGSGTMQLAHSPATNVVVNSSGGLTLGSANGTSTVDLNGQTLTVNGGGNISLASGNRYITSTATGGVMLVTASATTLSNTGTLTFATGTTLELQTGFDGGASGAINMNSTLQIDANGYMTNNGHAPTYGTGSTLVYNTGGSYTIQPSSEWYEYQFAQPGVPYNVTVTGSGTAINFNASGNQHEMWGNLTINSGNSFSLNPTGTPHPDLYIKGNWINNGTFSTNGHLVQFNGTTPQTMTGATTFDYLQLSNSTGLTIFNDATVTTQLIFTSGIITTGSNKVNVTSTSSTSVTGHGTGNYVYGNLKRNVASSTSYDFPVGTATNYELANINFGAGLTGTSNLTAYFTAGPATAPAPATCIINGTPMSGILNGGYWTITPDVEPTAGTYTSTLNLIGSTNLPSSFYGYTSGGVHQTITPSMQIGLIKRPNSGSGWLGCGVTVYGHSSTDQHLGTTPTVGGTISGSVVTVVRSAVPSFSDFAIGIEQNPTYALPVQLLYFTAAPSGADALLSWATATELNNNYFAVERSTDGVNFSEIGQVQGHGTTNVTNNYTYTDPDIAQFNAPVLYYRLKQVDFDGNFTYTNIAAVNVGNVNNVFRIISSYPNPFNNHYSVSFYAPQAQDVTIAVYDIKGALVSEETINAATGLNVYSIPNAGALAAGFYSMRVNAGSQSFGIKMVKQQ